MPKNDAKQPAIAPSDAKVSMIPGIKLSMAVGKEVVLRVPGVQQSYRGRVVGFDPYEYIIISVRLPAKVRRELPGGGQVVLKYLHQGTVYGFRAHTLETIRTPAPLIFIEYPSVIEKVELRRESRREVNIDGELYADEKAHDCLVVNLSTTGCMISARATAKDPLTSTAVDDTMVVAFSLGTDGILKLPLAIRNIKRERGILTLGAMFLDMNPKEEEAIKQYLDKVRRLTR